MTPERAAEIAAGDPTFVPGARGQGRRRASRTLGGRPGTVAATEAVELEYVPANPLWRAYSLRPEERFDEKAAQADARRYTMGLITAQAWEGIVGVAVKDAQRGNPHARQFLADYVLGKPGEKLEVDVSKSLADMMRRSLDERT